MKSITIGIVCGVAALGFGVVYNMISKPDEPKGGPLVPAQVVEQLAQGETEEQRKFRSMAIPANEEPECALPFGWKVPERLADKGIERAGLLQILRIMALEKWQETGSCECFYNQISWDEVAARAPEFELNDNSGLRFNISELRAKADDLEQHRIKGCNL